MKNPFFVLKTTKKVLADAKFVRINQRAVKKQALIWARTKIKVPSLLRQFHLFDNEDKLLQYIFILDAINFCFWPSKGEKRWGIFYQKNFFKGSFALAFALLRAIEKKIPILESSFLKTITLQQFKKILRGRGELLLLPERVKILHEIGEVLEKKFQGEFVNLVKKANQDVIKLIKLILADFPSFRDENFYRERRVYFYKKVQLLAYEIYHAFQGKSFGKLKNIDRLTVLSDYRVPQILYHFGILEYPLDLQEKIKNLKEIPAGSQTEIEIRAATIWAGEYLKQELKRQGILLRSFEIDWILWNLSHKIKIKFPHHRTKTTYY